MTFSSSSLPSQEKDRVSPLRPGLSTRLLDRLLPHLHAGRLHLTLPGGETVERRGASPGPEAALALRRWRAPWRILVEGEDGFSSAYIDGDWTTPDLAALFDLGMRNETALEPQSKSWLLSLVRNRLFHALHANTRRGSRRNIAAHYDLGNGFFKEWLDAGMNYSSALYRGDETLEQAQLQKLDRIAALLELRGGERILEIGSGWGALAERLVGHYGGNLLGITLSVEQLAYAKARLHQEIADGRADFRLVDYRDVTGRFERIVSVEMIEAVGERYWPAYFAKLRECLTPGGSAVIQAITIDESRFRTIAFGRISFSAMSSRAACCRRPASSGARRKRPALSSPDTNSSATATRERCRNGAADSCARGRSSRRRASTSVSVAYGNIIWPIARAASAAAPSMSAFTNSSGDAQHAFTLSASGRAGVELSTLHFQKNPVGIAAIISLEGGNVFVF